MPSTRFSRRKLLKTALPVALFPTFTLHSKCRRAFASQSEGNAPGVVIGEPTADQVGMQVLRDGGNAIDAIVAAALTSAIAAPAMTGIGGYGMSAIVASANHDQIWAIDGNTMAPAAVTADVFKPDKDGNLPPGINGAEWLSSIGWLTAGVPGILAGLQLAINEFGTRGFAELAQPAIALARSGFPWPQGLANAVNGRSIFKTDVGSRNLFFPDGKPLTVGAPFKNPALADMLSELANKNTVDAFYRGDIAAQIANSFQRNGGLVTFEDMANYQARLVPALKITWGSNTIHTAPLTAGGLSVLQMLQTLKAMNWNEMPNDVAKLHARIEAMRLAWRDRVTLLGDPDFANVPVDRLLSSEYAKECSDRILFAVKNEKLLTHNVKDRPQQGTINLCAADSHGNFVALTLTHGNSFGACVTVDELGLTLGHGLSRFDPDEQHPNAPGPGKRPLHNMVPTIVTRNGKPVLAVGGVGGRKIPNGLFEVLSQYVVNEKSMAESIAAPRLHTEGAASILAEKSWPTAELESLRKIGFDVKTGGNATMSAVAIEDNALVKAKR
jgi:gamma-glutamyltranspeptidase / glutathione hydrolase